MDVGMDMTQADLKGIVEADTHIPSQHQALIFNGTTLQEDHKTLRETGLSDGEVLELQDWRATGQAVGQGSLPPQEDSAEPLRHQALEHPEMMEQMRRHQPRLAEAINDPQQFREEWARLRASRDHVASQYAREAESINVNPMDIEAQRKIEERIREQLVMANLEATIENHPEGEPIQRGVFS